MTFDLTAYLDRIGVDSVRPDAEGLRRLQQAHMRAIPFENLDPLLGRVPALGLDAIFAKLVPGGRGGYCFEHNSLFGAALQSLGFSTRRMLARVRMRSGEEAARSHLVLRVNVDGRSFLADVGFGGPGSLMPLDLGVSGRQDAPNGAYRLREDAAHGETVLERRYGDDWLDLYAFDGARVSDGEIAAANYFCATWDEAPFGSHAMLGCYRGEARYGVFDRALTIETPQGEERRQIADAGEFVRLVQEEMGISLGAEELAQAWQKFAG